MATPMLSYPSTCAVWLSHVWWSTPTWAESMVPSTPWSQLHGTRETHQNECTSSPAKGRSGKGGASAPPSHTHASTARLVDREVRDAHTRREPLRSDHLGRALDDAPRNVDLPPVVDAAHAVALDPCEQQRGAPVRAQLVEEPDASVLGAERDVLLAEETHRHRRRAVHEV